MLLHNSPLNEAREAQGNQLLTAFGFGAGHAPPATISQFNHSVHAADPFSRGLATGPVQDLLCFRRLLTIGMKRLKAGLAQRWYWTHA
ncbi:MAG: hypothetical protein R3F37_01605 [Candidatus Competibacteraceae bacterium]